MIEIEYNGTIWQMPAPDVFEPIYNTQVKSAQRNSNGSVVRETLPDKWTLDFLWTAFQDPNDFYEWFNVLKSLTRVDFLVRFPAPTGAEVESTFYISPISAKMLKFSGGTGGTFTNLKCKFVEV